MTQPETIHFEPREYSDPETGRRITQLTHGEDHCSPLYYFIPSTTAEGDTLIFHRWAEGQIQMWKLDIASGQARRLTNARNPGAPRHRWMFPPTFGVKEVLSVFNTITRELIYYAGLEIRGVQIDSLEDRLIYTLPAGREGGGQGDISPDGKYLVFSHMDEKLFDNGPGVAPDRADARGGIIELLELETGQSRQLFCIHTWITHILFQDENRILFTHPATENGLMIADINARWYAVMRSMDGPNPDGPLLYEYTSHFQATSQGISYEMRSKLGLCDPYTFELKEYSIADYPVTHIGRDPEARLWFFDTKRLDPKTGDHTGPRCICFMPELKFDAPNHPIMLMSGAPYYGEGQHTHVHPQLMPDRKNILCVLGDDRSQSHHINLLDVSDLEDTRRERR